MDNLRKVFERMRRANLRINQEKCSFFKKKLAYLGHVISDQPTHELMGAEEMPRDGLMVPAIRAQLRLSGPAHNEPAKKKPTVEVGAGATECLRSPEKFTDRRTGAGMPRFLRQDDTPD
ncbi:uncharacterized protein [Drosophila suzukii]|uniref:Uncharacterized protein isoform X2 n=1 Tax=Drosophila suzukii TaxID=28584 RepID=A0ABM4TPU8_DROSZ